MNRLALLLRLFTTVESFGSLILDDGSSLLLLDDGSSELVLAE